MVSWPDRYYRNPAYTHHLMVISIWLLFSLAFFLTSVFARIKLRKQIFDFCEEITSETVLAIRVRWQSCLGMKKTFGFIGLMHIGLPLHMESSTR